MLRDRDRQKDKTNGDIQADRQTNRQKKNDYYNHSCACTLRINN